MIVDFQISNHRSWILGLLPLLSHCGGKIGKIVKVWLNRNLAR
jgi:hypothetical protein